MPKIIGVSDQISQHINRRVTQSIFHAFDFAEASGHGFNTYVVINLREDAEASMVRTFVRICHKYRDWLAHKRKTGATLIRPLYTSAMENPGDAHAHVNWVLHLPLDLVDEFRRKLPRWVERARGVPPGPFDIDIQTIEPGTEKSLAKYIVKGTDPAFIEHFHLQRVAAPQGAIWGRRAGISRTLGRAARDASGYVKVRRIWRHAARPLYPAGQLPAPVAPPP